ncbi:MAG: DUF4185 domain-containing protein [bacterium JZ-2024 1]
MWRRILVSISLTPMVIAPGATPSFEVESARVVCPLTGTGQAGVKGQDSAIIVPFRGKTLFFFGDTTLVSGGMIPNSRAETGDGDASDCLTLEYTLDDKGMVREVLSREGKEATVWIHSVFTVGSRMYAFYYTVAPGWPAPPASYGTGMAVSEDGGRSFRRTHLIFPKESLYSETVYALLRSPFVYLVLRKGDKGFGSLYLARVPQSGITDKSAYRVWDGKSWVPTEERATPLFDNAGAPSIQWNPYLGKWLAVYTAVLSEQGLLSQIEARVSDDLTGPWSPPAILYRCPNEPKREWGSCYNAHHNAIFDRNGGRTIYVTATDWLPYNVYLYEFILSKQSQKSGNPEG